MCWCAGVHSASKLPRNLLSLHLGHASLEVVDHLPDHGVIPNAVLLPISFELLISLEVSQCFQLCLKHSKRDMCRQVFPLAETSFLHRKSCGYKTALGPSCQSKTSTVQASKEKPVVSRVDSTWLSTYCFACLHAPVCVQATKLQTSHLSPASETRTSMQTPLVT